MTTATATKQTLHPLADRIVVQALAKEEITASGIVLPDTASKEKPQQGKVVAVGPGKKSLEGKIIPVDIEVGDTVLFTKYSPTEVEIAGEDLLVLSETDILAKVK